MLLVGTGRAVCADLPSLVAYPAPEGVDLNDDFTVQVRQDGGEWKTLPSYLVKVDEGYQTLRGGRFDGHFRLFRKG